MGPLPWLPFMAIDWLTLYLNPLMTMFEWGTGVGTNWFGNHVGHLITIEHDSGWANDMINKLGHNIKLHFHPPGQGEIGDNPSNPFHYRAGPMGGVNFKAYASAIDQYNKFDVVLVDGRARASCIYHARNKVRSGGILVIDNTERPYYLINTMQYFKDWDRLIFYGNGPLNTYKWETTILINQ